MTSGEAIALPARLNERRRVAAAATNKPVFSDGGVFSAWRNTMRLGVYAAL